MSAVYDLARQKFLQGDGVNWLSDTIKAILVDTTAYTVNLATHDFLDDVPSGARIAISNTLTGKTSTAGVAAADTIVFPAVTGAVCNAIILYEHTGTESTSVLIAYISSTVGLPVTPNGGDVVLLSDFLFKL